MERQRESSKHGLDRFGNMDTPGIEPGASRMLSGCDTTTPCALLAQLDLVDFLVHLLAFHLMIRNKQYRQRFATSCSAEFFTCFSRSLSLSLSLSLSIYIYIYHYSSLSLSLSLLTSVCFHMRTQVVFHVASEISRRAEPL